MIIPHLYLNGQCEEAISFYIKAFDAKINVVIPYPDQDNLRGVMHSEIIIQGQRIMLSDSTMVDLDYNRCGYAQLVVIFDNEDDLKKCYEMLREGSRTITPLQSSIYTSCQVEFWDRFGVFWGFRVGN